MARFGRIWNDSVQAKVENRLNWRPRIRFEDGLRETIEWYGRNEEWIAHVRSGEYMNYHNCMHKQRRRTLSYR